MSHPFFRDRILVSIAGALRAAETARLIGHPGMQGTVREVALRQLFEPLLPQDVAIGRGKIVDATGRESRETDLIVYSPRLLAPMLYAPAEGLFPVEACFFAIEVKTEASAQTLADAFEKAEALRLLRFSSGNTAMSVGRAVPFLFFAFGSDLSFGGKTELRRYRELDPAADSKPTVSGICVAGRGYWMFSYVATPPSWVTSQPQTENEEVLDFLAGVVNSLPDNLSARGRPGLGEYIMNDKPYTRERPRSE